MIIQIGILDILSKGSKSYLIQTFNSDINVGDTLIFKSHRFKVLSKDKYGFKAFKILTNKVSKSNYIHIDLDLKVLTEMNIQTKGEKWKKVI